MKNIILALALIGQGCQSLPSEIMISENTTNSLYIKTYGNPSHQSIVFLHGGPGFHSYSFETTTAKGLSELGYYVIVYDRRGEGRSTAPEGYAFNFENALRDLNEVIQSTQISHPILLGHSFGGTLALKHAEKFPNKSLKTILVGSPISYPSILKAILENSRNAASNDNCGLSPDEIHIPSHIQSLLESLHDGNYSLQTVGSIFFTGMSCGIYLQPSPTPESQNLYSLLMHSPESPQDAFKGFLEEERYAEMDLSALIRGQKERTYAIYGDSDGLFFPSDLSFLKEVLNPPKVEVVENSSHDVFIHQQQKFFDAIGAFLNP